MIRLPPIHGTKFIFIILCLPFLFGGQPTLAQSAEGPSPAIRFSHLTTEQGLSESTVTTITQDERGFLWFGTQNGLDRYDGSTINEFSGVAQLPSNNIRALLADGEQLWLGTWGGGLIRLDLPTGDFTTFSTTATADEQRPGSDFIRAIHRDTQGAIWVGSNNGLDRLNAAQTAFTHYALPETNSQTVYTVAEDPAGNLWLGTDAGVFQLAADSPDIHANPVLPTDFLVNILWWDAPRSQLWAGTRGNGLYRLDLANGHVSHYHHDPANPDSLSADTVGALFSDRPDRLWVGTENGVDLLNLADPVAFRHLTHDDNDPTSIASGLVMAMFQDNNGGIWLSTWTSGLSFYHPARFKFPAAVPLPSFPVSFAPGADNTLWVGTFEHGLVQLDSDYRQIAAYQHHENDPTSLPDNAVMALLQDRQNRLWVGTLGGLCRLNADNTWQHYPAVNGLVRSLFEDDDGIIWVGTMDGLLRLDPDREQVSHYQHSDASGMLGNNIFSIFQDHSGVLWFGTNEGLNRLETAVDGRFTFSQPFNNPENPANLSHFVVTVIHEDQQNNLWLGSWGDGLAQIDAGRQTIRRYTKTDGLPDDLVLGILPDDTNHLWLSSSRGLARFALADASIRVFDLYDGLPSADFAQGAYLKRPDGALLFGADVGIVRFTPENLPFNPNPPPVILTNFQIFNQDIHPGTGSPLARAIEYTDQLTLRHDQSIFSFEFAALNYVSPQNSQYTYRMEGVDPGWNDTRERRFVTYTNLDPGQYTFRVRAANGDGVWNNDGVSLRLTILPPWWQTWWAYLLYAAGAIGLVGGFTYRRNRRYREKIIIQQKLLEQERHLRTLLEQLDVIQEEDRRRIAHEMHDGLAQTLAALRLRSQVWRTFLHKSPEKLPAEFDSLQQILDDSIQDVRRSIFALRPLALDEQGLLPALHTLAEEMEASYGLEIDVVIACPEQAFHHSLEHPLFRVAQELLHNVGKHAHAAHAKLELNCTGQGVRLTVSDDGEGIDPTAKSTAPLSRGGLGLRQMRERVQILGGSLYIDSSSAGTRVSIDLPLGEKSP